MTRFEPEVWSRCRKSLLQRRLWLRALSVSSGLLCNFVAVYLTFVQFILQLKLCLYTVVHLLLEEFTIALMPSLSRQSLCHTVSPEWEFHKNTDSASLIWAMIVVGADFWELLWTFHSFLLLFLSPSIFPHLSPPLTLSLFPSFPVDTWKGEDTLCSLRLQKQIDWRQYDADGAPSPSDSLCECCTLHAAPSGRYHITPPRCWDTRAGRC